MDKIAIHTTNPYAVFIEHGLLPHVGEHVRSLTSGTKVAVVTDDVVDALYGPCVCDSLQAQGFTVCRFVFPHGEGNKNPEQYLNLVRFLAQHGLQRSDALLALGGGVPGDLGGFAAATYMRGIAFFQVPTTLLACIDASIGGKTAIDLEEGKNLVGAFHQPRLVLIDPDVLKTLPPTVFRDGLGEGVKYSVLCGHPVFDLLKEGLDITNLKSFITRCVTYKGHIVENDEREGHLRQLLNLGHSLGHCTEKLSHYTLSHGHCVAGGLGLIARLSCQRGLLDTPTCQAILELLQQYQLPTESPYSVAELMSCLTIDKKASGQALSAVFIHGLGDCRIETVSFDALQGWLTNLTA